MRDYKRLIIDDTKTVTRSTQSSNQIPSFTLKKQWYKQQQCTMIRVQQRSEAKTISQAENVSRGWLQDRNTGGGCGKRCGLS